MLCCAVLCCAVCCTVLCCTRCNIRFAEHNFRRIELAKINASDKFIINGIANREFVYKGKQVTDMYNVDGDEDNPSDDPSNWQHCVAVVNGIVRA